jgi:hypothetical protein
VFYEQVVHQDRQFLRIELVIDEQEMPEVAALPWEFLCLPERANLGTIWLSTAPEVVFLRRRAQSFAAQPIQLQKGEKLRIALIVASPSDLPAVSYQPIQESLEKLDQEKVNLVELLPVLQNANPTSIDEVLSQSPHIVHFIGYCGFQNDQGQEIGVFLVNTDLNQAMWVEADYFSELLNQHRPGLVILQASQSGTLSASRAFTGVASRVLQQNIPVIIAMQYEVSDTVSSQFPRRFYKQLAEGDPVDIAAQCGRRAIGLRPEALYKKRDFATPVIYMRVEDGYLFERYKEEPPEPSSSIELRRRLEAAMPTMTVDEPNSTSSKLKGNSERTTDSQSSHSIEQKVQQSEAEYAVNVGSAQGNNYFGTVNQYFEADSQANETIKFTQEHSKEHTQSACKGVSILVEKMKIPEIRDAVVAFRTDFEAAQEQIRILDHYKGLHDSLHTLEFQCFNSLAQEVKRSSQEVHLEILIDCEKTLEETLEDINRLVAELVLSSFEILWVKDLESARNSLKKSIELHGSIRLKTTTDQIIQDQIQVEKEQKIKLAVRLISNTLNTVPATINVKLNSVACSLRLASLVRSLKFIQQEFEKSELALEKISHFQNSVSSLNQLNSSLATLIQRHDEWQTLDLKSRRTEATIDQEVYDLEISWSSLKVMSEIQYNNSTEEWAIAFRKDCENLERAILTKNEMAIKQYFNSYRRRVSRRFYKVDKDLKELCSNLRTVSESLALVLGMMA